MEGFHLPPPLPGLTVLSIYDIVKPIKHRVDFYSVTLLFATQWSDLDHCVAFLCAFGRKDPVYEYLFYERKADFSPADFYGVTNGIFDAGKRFV